MSKDLQRFVQDFATSMERIDKIVPPAKNAKTGEEYDSGIGPYQKKLLIEHVVTNLKKSNSSTYEKLETEVK